LIINSATKEESEVWVLDRSSEQTTPVKLLERRTGVTAHLDHLNDFFVTITNADASKAVKIQTLQDGATEWKDLLPLNDPTITVREFDGFKDFFAIYCKRQGVPSIVIQDFASGEFSEFTVDGQVGEISPGLNSNYDSKELHFFFQSPFVYEQTYVYSHEKRSKRMLG
jgi:protease II